MKRWAPRMKLLPIQRKSVCFWKKILFKWPEKKTLQTSKISSSHHHHHHHHHHRPIDPEPPRLAGIRGHHHGTRLGVLPWSSRGQLLSIHHWCWKFKETYFPLTSRAGTSHHSLLSWRLEYHLPMSRKNISGVQNGPLWKCCRSIGWQNVRDRHISIGVSTHPCSKRGLVFDLRGMHWITRGFLQTDTLIFLRRCPGSKKIVQRVLSAFHLMSVLCTTQLRQGSKRN